MHSSVDSAKGSAIDSSNSERESSNPRDESVRKVTLVTQDEDPRHQVRQGSPRAVETGTLVPRSPPVSRSPTPTPSSSGIPVGRKRTLHTPTYLSPQTDNSSVPSAGRFEILTELRVRKFRKFGASFSPDSVSGPSSVTIQMPKDSCDIRLFPTFQAWVRSSSSKKKI